MRGSNFDNGDGGQLMLMLEVLLLVLILVLIWVVLLMMMELKKVLVWCGVGGVIGDIEVNMYSNSKDDEEKKDQDYILFFEGIQNRW